MAENAKLGLDLEANTGRAAAAFKKFGSTGKKSFSQLEKASKQFSLAFKGAIALFAGKQVLGGFKAVTDAAIVQENAINNLNTALKLSGDFTEASSQNFQKFASELQNVSTQGDETTLELLALAKSFDTTDAGAKKLVLAATDLSAATGKAPQEALKQLAKSYSGLAGELGESLPATRDFTAEQLKAGAAIDLVIERFGGAASAQIQTFGGSVTQLKNSFGDLLEEIGFTLTKSPELIAAIGGIKDGINILGNFIKNSDIDFGALLADGIEIALKASVAFFKFFTTNLGRLSRLVLEVAKGFNLLASAVLDLGKSEKGLEFLQTAFTFLVDTTGAFIAGLSVVGDFLGFDTTSLESAALEMAKLGRETEKLNVEQIDTLQKSLDGNVESLTTMQDQVINLQDEFVDLGDDIVEAFEKGGEQINKTSKDLAAGLEGPQTKPPKKPPKKDASTSAFDGFGQKFISQVSAGAASAASAAASARQKAEEAEAKRLAELGIEGAEAEAKIKAAGDKASQKATIEAGEKAGQGLAKTLGKTAAQAIGGPIAGEVFGLFSELALMDDEEIKVFIDQLVSGFIQFVEILAEKAPVIIQALVDSLINDGGLVRIAAALIKAVIQLAGQFISFLLNGIKSGLDAFFGTFLTNFLNGAKEFLGGFLESILQIPIAIFTAIQNGAQAIFNAVSDALSIDLSGGGFGLGGDKGLLGGGIIPGLLNEGGVVGVSGYNNGGSIQQIGGAGNSDSVPLFATPGEVIIKKEAVGSFDQYVVDLARENLGRGSNENQTPIMIQVSLGDEILEERILRLNQNNARLA
jgi:hypothetical protein